MRLDMTDRWTAALEHIERELPLRVVSVDVLHALQIVRDDDGFGAVALERVARMVDALPHDLRAVRRALYGGGAR